MMAFVNLGKAFGCHATGLQQIPGEFYREGPTAIVSSLREVIKDTREHKSLSPVPMKLVKRLFEKRFLRFTMAWVDLVNGEGQTT